MKTLQAANGSLLCCSCMIFMIAICAQTWWSTAVRSWSQRDMYRKRSTGISTGLQDAGTKSSKAALTWKYIPIMVSKKTNSIAIPVRFTLRFNQVSQPQMFKCSQIPSGPKWRCFSCSDCRCHIWICDHLLFKGQNSFWKSDLSGVQMKLEINIDHHGSKQESSTKTGWRKLFLWNLATLKAYPASLEGKKRTCIACIAHCL